MDKKYQIDIYIILLKSITSIILLLLYFSLPSDKCLGQDLRQIEIPSSFNPVGSGARAMGMGGAFIAVADDATAASWNPAGLFQLEKPELSVVLSGAHRSEKNNFGTDSEASGTERVTFSDINYLSIASGPFHLFNRRMIASINFQRLFDLYRSWDFKNLSTEIQNVEYRQEGSISALGLAYCVQITPLFSLGVTFNIWGPGFNQSKWTQKITQTGSVSIANIPFNYDYHIKKNFSFNGYNFNIGLLWEVIRNKLKIGAVFKSPFEAELDERTNFVSNIWFQDFSKADQTNMGTFSEDLHLNMPMVIGVGLYYRIFDALIMSLDITRTSWDYFVLEDAEGNKTSPISGLPEKDSDVDATYTVRLGGEYRFKHFEGEKGGYYVPLRAGVFYDPAPAEGGTEDYYGFSIGTGFTSITKYFGYSIDIAYQYRYGNDVGQYLFPNLDFSQDVNEHIAYLSAIIRF